MEYPRLKRIFVFLLLAVPLTIVFAQGKLSLFGVPWYVPEILVASAFGAAIFLERGFPGDYSRRNVFFWGLFLMALGFSLSIFANDIAPHGYGRLKSWFFFPILYGTLLAFSLKKKMLSLEDVLHAVFLGGVLIGLSALMSIVSGGGFSYDHRLHGLFSSPNHLAMLLGTAILAGIFRGSSLQPKVGREGIFIFSGAFFLLVLLLLTQSYAVIFSLVMMLCIGLAKYRGRFSRKTVIVLCFGLALSLGALFFQSGDKWQGIMMQDERSSLASRGMIWQSASRMILDHPLLGIGPGNFQEQYLAYQRYFPPYLEWSVPHPHNMFLDMWLEGGILGFIGFGIFFFHWLFSATRYFWQEKNESALASLPFLFAVYFFLIGLVDAPFLRNDLAYFFVIAFVLSLTILSDRSSRRDD